VTAVQVLKAGRASLLLRDEVQDALRVVAAVGIPPSIIPSIRIPIGEGIAGVVAERGVVLFGSRTTTETFISSPVVTEERIEGVLNVTDRLGNEAYRPEHMRETSAVAAHIATLLHYRSYATRDVTTGLANRTGFIEIIEAEMARGDRTGSNLSLVFLDVDNLKQINDSRGHAAGDSALRTIANALQSITRGYDSLCRWGGDEFAMILPGATTSAFDLAKRIEAAIEASPNGDRPAIGFSLGLAKYPGDGSTSEELIARADERMYAAKNHHRRS
jgi:diguanylate cyclase (GGDEF)-like protein